MIPSKLPISGILDVKKTKGLMAHWSSVLKKLPAHYQYKYHACSAYGNIVYSWVDSAYQGAFCIRVECVNKPTEWCFFTAKDIVLADVIDMLDYEPLASIDLTN